MLKCVSLKDHLLNLAFLITWYCRVAEIELGGVGEWDGGKCTLFVGCVVVSLGDVNCYFDGVCLFHFYFKSKQEHMDLWLCKKKTHQSLVIELRQTFSKLRGKWDEYVYFIVPRSLIGNKVGTFNCSSPHQRLWASTLRK